MKIHLTWFDIVILMTITIFIIRNAWIGFIRGLSSLLGLAAGYIAASRFGGQVEAILLPWLDAPTHWLKAFAFGITFAIGFLSVFIIAELLSSLLKKLRLSWVDHILGAALGLLKGGLIVTFIFILLVTFYPQSEHLFRDSFTYPYIANSARFLAEFFPSKWKSRFNYNLRHYLKPAIHEERI